MSSLLLHADEETDPGVYGAYLRAQADADLLDVARHLDPERYPARCDAAGREIRRRGLLQPQAFTRSEMAIRRLALGALALAPSRCCWPGADARRCRRRRPGRPGRCCRTGRR